MGPSERSRGSAKRRRGLQLERLEGRDLLSVVPIFMAQHGRAVASANDAAVSALAGAGDTTGQPTPRTLHRQAYMAKFSGTYGIAPGAYTDQKLQGYVFATGGSNQSLHLELQMRFFIPKDPTQPATGVATLLPRNAATTGSTLILDLTSVPNGSGSLPTHYTWTVDSSSGGLYTNGGGFGQGQGTLDIRYLTGGRRSGRASIVIQGQVNASGIFSNIASLGNRS